MRGAASLLSGSADAAASTDLLIREARALMLCAASACQGACAPAVAAAACSFLEACDSIEAGRRVVSSSGGFAGGETDGIATTTVV